MKPVRSMARRPCGGGFGCSEGVADSRRRRPQAQRPRHHDRHRIAAADRRQRRQRRRREALQVVGVGADAELIDRRVSQDPVHDLRIATDRAELIEVFVRENCVFAASRSWQGGRGSKCKAGNFASLLEIVDSTVTLLACPD